MESFIYEVTIKMSDKSLTNKQVSQFINEELMDVEITSINDCVVTLCWPIGETEGPHEIEEALYYVLDDGDLGTYSYSRVN